MRHNRLFLIAVLTATIGGCATPLGNPDPVKPVVDYSIVITDPQKEILPPPKFSDTYPNEDTTVIDPVHAYLSRLKDYNKYVSKSVNTLEYSINANKANEEDDQEEGESDKDGIITAEGFTFKCGQSVVSQIDIGERPHLEINDLDKLTDSDIARLALKHAKALKEYNEQSLKKITRGVSVYKKYCR